MPVFENYTDMARLAATEFDTEKLKIEGFVYIKKSAYKNKRY